jgi:hypothetical protein
MIERVVDGGVSAEEELRRSGRFEALHLAFASSHHLVRVRRPIVGSQSAVMPGAKAEISERCDVRAELVGDDHRRHDALPLQQFLDQLQRRAPVASTLHQKIDNLALVVDRAPEVHLLATDPDHHLVEMPM